MARIYLIFTAILGLSAVVLGAFGAHGLKKIVSPEVLAVYNTAVQYQFYHTLALLMISVLLLAAKVPQVTEKWLARSALGMLIGTFLFSGSLYSYAFSGVKVVAMITPLGGVVWIIGWLFLLLAAWHMPQKTKNQK